MDQLLDQQIQFRQHLGGQLFRFVCVGMMNTAFSYSVFASLIYCHFHYAFAALGSSVCGTLFSFQTIGRLVFRNYHSHLIGRFLIAAVVSCLFNICTIRFLHLFLDNLYLIGFLALIPVSMGSFLMNKFFVFARRDFAGRDKPA